MIYKLDDLPTCKLLRGNHSAYQYQKVWVFQGIFIIVLIFEKQNNNGINNKKGMGIHADPNNAIRQE